MNYTSQKIEQAIEIASEYIADADPGVPRMTDVAEKVAEDLACSVATARKYLRTAVDAGRLIELKPTRGWFVRWPSAEKAGFTSAYNIPRMTMTTQWGTGENKDRILGRRIEITIDREKNPPSSYGPGNTTYLLTNERADALVETWAGEAEAKKEAEEAARNAAKEAERKEIDRRSPGLRALVRRMGYLLRTSLDFRTDGGSSIARLMGDSEGKPVEEQSLNLNLMAWGSQAETLRTILELGVKAYLGTQPVIQCQHCGQRIASAVQNSQTVWWHIETAIRRCKGAQTLAEPEDEESSS